jgi:hypothetical protein
MPAERKRRIVLMLLATACMQRSLYGVIAEFRLYHGEEVTCLHSGLRGVAKLAGTEQYARVFTGAVVTAAEIGGTDKYLEIVPDEVFVGDSNLASAITNQACLNYDIQIGDRWLFYLYRDPGNKGLLLQYDGPSKPIAEADDDISTLRDLGRLTNKGLIIGTMERWNEGGAVKPTRLADHQVIARDVNTGALYSTFTSESGYFRFDLPEGTYDIAPAPEYGLVEIDMPLSAMKGSILVQKLRCWQHDLLVVPAEDLLKPQGQSKPSH